MMIVTTTSMMTINKPRVCLISDLHLGVHSNSSRWHEIAIEWANWLKEDLKRRNIKDILFCGDWHHNRSEISVSTLQISADILHILEDFNIIAVLGNHDIYYKHRLDVNSLSIFKGRKNITILDKITPINVFDRSVVFCPWDSKVQDIPECDVLLGHFEIETFKMNTYKVCDTGIRIKDLLDKTNLVISGHFHLRHERKFNNGTILYVGNPFQMDFGDCGNAKGYHILDFDTLEYEFIENTISPIYNKIDLSELVSYGNITKEIINIFSGNIVKLIIDRNISPDDLSYLVSKLSLLKPEQLITENNFSGSLLDNNDLEKDLSGIDIEVAIEEFINMLEIDNRKDILDYTLDLYNRCMV